MNEVYLLFACLFFVSVAAALAFSVSRGSQRLVVVLAYAGIVTLLFVGAMSNVRLAS